MLDTASANDNNSVQGLLDASIVGINKENYLHEVKYPVPSSPDFVIRATDFGVVANDKRDDTVALQAAIASAKSKPADKVKVLVLPAGDIDFIEGFNAIDDTYGIVIDSIDNLILEGQDTNIYLHFGALGFRGMHVINCKNFEITKVNIDWDKVPFSMGVVESFDLSAKTAIVQVNKSYTVDASTQVIQYQEFDKDSNLPREDGNFLYNLNEAKYIKGVQFLGNNRLKITFDAAVTKAPVGTKVALSQTVHFSETFIIDNCVNVKFETVNLYSSPGMSIVTITCTNLYFNRFNCITKPGTDRLLTSTSDILHLTDTAGEIVITNCTLENSQDDGLNVSGHYLRIQEISGDRLRVVSPLGMGGTFKPSVNDLYEASDISTFDVKKTLTVSKVEDSDNGYWITVKEGTAGLVINNALANLTRTPKLTFVNNLVRNKRNRGILVQTRDVLIANNAFGNIRDGAIQLISEVNVFNECTAPKHVVIKNNKFLNNNTNADADIEAAAYGPQFAIGNPTAISDITIENNFMAYSKNAALAFKGVSDIHVRGNLIYNPATNPTQGSTNSAILLQNVTGLTLDGNKVYGGTEFGFKSVFMYGGVDAENITLTGNIGINQADVFGDQKNIEIAKSNAPINLTDNSLSDWANVGTTIDMAACTDIHTNEVKLSLVPASDFSQTTKFLWKDDGIYFSFDVMDESIQFNPSLWWEGDGMEMFLSTNTKSFDNTGAVKLTNDDTFQLFMKPESAGGNVFFAPRTSDVVMAKKSQFKLNIWVGGNGYQGEGFIPFTAVPGVKDSILAAKPVAISVSFGDSDVGNETIDPMTTFMTFSTVRHSTTTNKMIPADMTKFIFKQ